MVLKRDICLGVEWRVLRKSLKVCIFERTKNFTTMQPQKQYSLAIVAPVVFGFYIFGFSDIVGFSTSYVQAEYALSNKVAGLLPSMVFIWFLFLALPTARMMNRIGRKATATIGYLISIVGLVMPILPIDYFEVYFVAFALIGIGNMVLQVAVNPLLATLAPTHQMTGYLTLGQVARNLSLMLASPIASYLSLTFGDWRTMFPIFAVITLVAMVWLLLTPLPPEPPADHTTTTRDMLDLLHNKSVRIAFIGIALFIACDVGAGVLTPQLIIERAQLSTEMATLSSSIYYAWRIIGTVVGLWAFSRLGDVRWLRINMVVLCVVAFAMFFVEQAWAIFALSGVWGFVISCVFATFYAAATKSLPDKANEISGLMIMAISSGALIGPLMGLGADLYGGNHNGALVVVMVAVVALTMMAFLLKNVVPSSGELK